MRLITVGSGSHGNCYLVEKDGSYLALDAGCSWKEVLKACDFNVTAINACLVTHVHRDHCSNYRDFVKNGIPCYANEDTATALTAVYDEKILPLKDKKVFSADFGRYRIIPFYVPHEETPNSAFIIIWEDGTRLFYATDFEYIPFTVKTWDIDHFLIAINHSEDIPEGVEAREHRIRGHSSLETVKKFLELSVTENCKSVTACHLSGSYADPDRIESELRSLLRNNIKVSIARKGETIIF